MNESKLPSVKIKTPANNLDLKEMILPQLKEGVLVFNKKGDVIYSNDKVNDILRINVNDHPNNIREKDLMIYDKHGQLLEKKNWPFIGVIDQEIEFENETIGIENASQQITWLSLSIHPATTEKKAEKYYVATFSEITDLKKTHEKLKESEMFFNAFMKNSPTMSWVYDDKSRLIYGNPLFLSTVHLTTEDFNKKLHDITSSPDLERTIAMRIKQVLSSGKTIIAEDVIEFLPGMTRYYISYWFLMQTSQKKKLIGGHSIDITEKKISRQELEKANERMNYVASANADAIWDMDIKANEVFRNNSFYTLTGYKQKEVKPTLEWLLDHVHPDDRKNLEENIKKDFASTHTHWQHEYRLKIADGRYLHILDKAFAIYENKKLVRIIGGMQNITDMKLADSNEKNEILQKQKITNQATIKAQEAERNRISGELHDNVNQLLMSAKMHISVAKKNHENSEELLTKASDYILMAVEEIRSISKKLNSSILSITGLQRCIQEIANNMYLTKDINTICSIDETLIEKIVPERQLMIYRIVQEQTNNIIKYSEASAAFIKLHKEDNELILEIGDNGIGFKKEERLNKGLGFTNIFNRVNAYNGAAQIETTPGKGCTIIVKLPMEE